MELSYQELCELAARAATLTERGGPDFAPDSEPDGEQLAIARLEKWRQVAAPGDPGKFAQRLAWAGLDEAAARRLLGKSRLADNSPLPGWTHTLQAGLRAAEVETQPGRFIDPAAPYPFEELMSPFILEKING